MDARIYQPAKTAVQSGRANTRRWILEIEPRERQERDPLMGWWGSSNTERQVTLYFDSKDEAVAYARKHGLSFRVHEPHKRVVRPKSYAENFIRKV